MSKIFVLLACRTCPHVNNIPGIYNTLKEKDVTLHVITSQPEFLSRRYTAIDANGNVMYEDNQRVKINTITAEQNDMVKVK